jgi:hypothetical protein
LSISENNPVDLDAVLKCNLHTLVMKSLNDEQLSATDDDLKQVETLRNNQDHIEEIIELFDPSKAKTDLTTE